MCPSKHYATGWRKAFPCPSFDGPARKVYPLPFTHIINLIFPLEYTNDGSVPGGIFRKSLKKMVIASHRNDRHFLKRSGTGFFSVKAEKQGKNFSRLAAKLKIG
jgi:hypothetical protein